MQILNDWSYRQGKANLRALDSWTEAMELATSIAAYEALINAGSATLELGSLEEFPVALIKARIARGWTQERLAQELDLPKQQIQRYEASGYASASLRRLLDVAEALDLRFVATIEAGRPAGRDLELARALAGYAAAGAVQQVERRLRLRRMTPEEARGIFDDLCNTYYQLAPLHRPSPSVMSARIDHRLAVRKAMAVLARKGGRA